GGKLYDVISVPAPDPDGDLNGALTLGTEIGSATAGELSRFTHSQIVLLADDQVIVSTLPSADTRGLADLSNEIFKEACKTNDPLVIKKETLASEHYYCSGGC